MAKPMDTFKPGLFHTGLNTEKKLNNRYLLTEIKTLGNEFETETIYIKPTICNLQALFYFHMDGGRTTARSILEKLIKDNPKDLNALADLIYVYKEMGLDGDSDEYKTHLEFYKEDPLSQAKSILGQAYALTKDLPDDQCNSPRDLLKDTWRQLNAKSKYSEQISKANKLIVEAYKVAKEIPKPCHKKTIDEIKMVIEKYEKGIKMLENLNGSEKEILVWKHNLANLMININGKDESKDFENQSKALETHLDVIENLSRIKNLEESLKIYVAKSSIAFVKVVYLRKDGMKNAQFSERIKSQNIDSLLKNAISICPDSHTIWKKYGVYLKNSQNNSKAIDALSKSISLIPDPDINWFAYSSRCDAYYYYSLNLITEKSDENKINENLQCAYNDIKITVQSKCTDKSMLQRAQICFQLAKPNLYLFHCQDTNFIYESLNIIHEALKRGHNTKNIKFYLLLGKCYPIIKEYRKGIESLKTAMELNKWSENFPVVFKILCRCFIAFYESEKDMNLLTEFRFMLKEASQRGRDEWITTAMQMIQKKHTEMMISLVQNIIQWDAKGCKEIIKKALTYRECKALMGQFQIKLQEEDNQETEINGPNEIQNSERTSSSFQYDFFVSHSEKDKDWVNNMLRPNLEEYDEEIKFKGFIPSRDFVPGERVFESIDKGIRHCRKLVILLTPNYLNNNWKRYMNDPCLSTAIKKKVSEKTIIPIILERCRIPNEFKDFTPIDFTEQNDWDELRMSLTVNKNS